MKKLLIPSAIALLLATCTTQEVDSAISIFRGAVSGYERSRATPVPVEPYVP